MSLGKERGLTVDVGDQDNGEVGTYETELGD